jgi:hypothetical protein
MKLFLIYKEQKKRNKLLPLTSVLQKWGISTKFEHWYSIKLNY